MGRLTLAQKALALILLPLLLQLTFVLLVVQFQMDLTAAQRWAAHTKEVLAVGQEVPTALADAQSGVRGFALTRDPGFVAPHEAAVQELPRLLDRLETLVADNPAQTARLAVIRKGVAEVLTWYGEIVRLVREGSPGEATARLKARHGKRLADAVRAEVGAFLAEEERLDRARTEKLDRSCERLNLLLVAGGIVAVAGTVGLVAAFRRGIGRRFATLMANTRRLAVGKELPPPLDGSDELAHLDRALREMIAALGQSAEALRASDEQLRLMVDGVRDYAILMLDPNGRIVSWNAGAERIKGYTAEEIIGRHFSIFYPPEVVARGWPEEELRRATAEGRIEDEGWRVRKDGSRFWANVVITAIRDATGTLRGFGKVTRDVTERKRAEDEVRRLNAELEDRVRARTAELEAANRDLSHKNAENEMFVYSVSHDLRSPLVNLQGFSKELEKGSRALAALLNETEVPPSTRDRARTLLDGKMAKSVGFIQTAVMRLSGIIDALLRLSRAGRVEYRWEVVDVAGLVARVVAAAHGTITGKEATIRVGELPPAWGDRTAVEQVFGNLLGNALTYLDPTRPGVIEIGALPDEDGGSRTYYVRDNGLGIPEAHRQKIFQAFQRAHPGVGSGEGLGLAIVARIVERHRGKVWVESHSGQGSTFFVTLPTPPTENRQAASTHEE